LVQSNFAFSKAITIFAAGFELFSHKKDNKHITNMKQKLSYESPQAVLVETRLESSILQASINYASTAIFGPATIDSDHIIGGTDGSDW
jgi:hypothetical protein